MLRKRTLLLETAGSAEAASQNTGPPVSGARLLTVSDLAELPSPSFLLDTRSRGAT